MGAIGVCICAPHHIELGEASAPGFWMPVNHAELESIPLLSVLAPARLEELARTMVERSFARRQIVLQKGVTAHSLGFLLEGRLQGTDFTVDGREVGLYFVAPKDYFGELSVVDGLPQKELVVAVASSRVAFLPRQSVRSLVASVPAVGEALLARLAARLRLASEHFTMLAMPNPFQRVCALLLRLGEQDGRAPPVGAVVVKTSLSPFAIRNAPTQQELAITVNTSRETVTRVFQVLQLRRVLQRDGQALQVRDPDFLRDVALGRVEPPKIS